MGPQLEAAMICRWPCRLSFYILGPMYLGEMRFMSRPFSIMSSLSSLCGWVLLFFSAVVTADVIAQDAKLLDQRELKERLREQILSEVADSLLVERDQITVYLDDRRLVVPNCNENFVISLPFSDRSTVEASCHSENWTKYIRVSVGDYRPLMVYRQDLPAGHSVKRGDVKFVDGRGMSSDKPAITTIDQAINRLLKQNVFVNEPVRPTDFSMSQSQDAATSEPLETEVLIATTTINRGVRLDESMFERQIRRGRLPSDLIFGSDELNHLQANRIIVAGDALRRSMVSLAAAVKKGDLIEIRIEKGALSVSAMVRALTDGSVGDVIEVVNAESGRPLRAKIVDIGSLEII
jgi:flagella basal body P-ring formation protein FlgA